MARHHFDELSLFSVEGKELIFLVADIFVYFWWQTPFFEKYSPYRAEKNETHNHGRYFSCIIICCYI